MALRAATKYEKPTSSPRQMILTAAGLVVVIAVLLLAFTLPGVHAQPNQLPVAIVASGQQKSQIESALTTAGPGTFDIDPAASPAEARAQVLHRQVYAAFVAQPHRLTVDTASAASEAVSTLLTAQAHRIATVMRTPVTVHDLRPFTSRDPRGVGLAAGALPVSLGGWIAAIGMLALIVGTWQLAITAVGFAAAGGLGLAGLLYAIGSVTGNYFADAAVAALGIAATCFLVLGLNRLLKGAGLAVAAVLLILLGNPLSGLSSAPQLLPGPWGTLGQLLPPGATGTLLRNVSFFGGAAITTPLITLSAWLAAGVVMYAVATWHEEAAEHHSAGRHAPAGNVLALTTDHHPATR